MAAFKIESGIEMPRPTHSGKKELYPFSQMHVGDSFFVKNKKARSMSATVWLAAKRLPMKFACRTVPGGVRVWRTA